MKKLPKLKIEKEFHSNWTAGGPGTAMCAENVQMTVGIQYLGMARGEVSKVCARNVGHG